MPLAGLESTTGTTIEVFAGEPATFDIAGYKALAMVKVIGVVTFGEWGDGNEDVSEPLLSEGRVIHTNGTADGGEVEISVQYRDTDAGSDILIANAGSNDPISIKKVYRSGDTEFACCATNWMRFRDNQDETLRRACAGGRA